MPIYGQGIELMVLAALFSLDSLSLFFLLELIESPPP